MGLSALSRDRSAATNNRDMCKQLSIRALKEKGGGARCVPLIRAVVELDAGERAGELAAARDPRDGGALIEEVHRVHGLVLVGLDHLHAEDLALLLIGDELRWQHLHPPRASPSKLAKHAKNDHARSSDSKTS